MRSDAVAINDGAGEFHAARNVVRGRNRVARLHVGLARRYPGLVRVAIRSVNGLPAAAVEFTAPPPGVAPRTVLAVSIDADGRISAVYSILASRKLRRIGPI